ncbi:MAG: glycosyltransferase family 4 protein [Paludibacter sp.]|jgi:glycosyltransferase involved in cell wall biosynthesis|nr:glycosyltransferase family 4 protein [Paludibacter sp.]
MKRVWLINQYAMPPELESRLRTIKFAQYLTQKGYDVTIFASSVMHNMDIDLISDKSIYTERKYGNIKFVHIKCISYKSNGLARIISSIQFPHRLKKLANRFEKPDVIIQTATVPFGNSLFYLAKKMNAKYIVEVLDLWPESFVDMGILSRNNPLMYFAYKAEKWLYEKADAIVYSMEGGLNYLLDKKWDKVSGGKIDTDKVYYINNGVDLDDFDYNANNFKLVDDDLSNDKFKKVIYIGSIRLANNLKRLIDAAEILRNNTDVKFLLYGDGDERSNLEEYCKENKIENVIFKQKWIEPKFVPYVLSCSTVNILNYMPGNFGKYGGSQSKMFQYMASAKPICSNLNMMFCPINNNKIGIAREFVNAQDYANSILLLTNTESMDYLEMCKRARETAKGYDYKLLVNKLEKLF